MSSEGKRCPACGRTDAEYAGDAGCAHSFHPFYSEIERLREAIEEAIRCLTLIGHAGKTWAEKANAAADVLWPALHPEDQA